MKGTVVIPCYNRPAFLKICFEHIINADECDNFQYIMALDFGYDKRCLDIIKEFPYSYAVSVRTYKIIGSGKQSNNVLSGLISAANFGLPVFYIEDDIFIAKDFFTFGLEVINNEPDILCVILSKNNNANDNPPSDINGYYVKENHNNYQSLGSIFNPELFLKYISKHHNPEYILRPDQYVKSVFPNSSLDSVFCEQDGLIRRIIEHNKLKVAFSCVPRCFHAGFFGYNRNYALHIQRMQIDKQVEQIKRIAFDVNQLRAIVRHENLVQDSLPCDLLTEHTEVKKIII